MPSEPLPLREKRLAWKDAIEDVAGMLPQLRPPHAREVARIALNLARPNLERALACDHVPGPAGQAPAPQQDQHGGLGERLLELHHPVSPWNDNVLVCDHDNLGWPCPTARLVLAPTAAAAVRRG